MKQLLKEKGVHFFTYKMKSEKSSKVVLRGIPVEIPTKEVSEELQARSYPVTKVTRMNDKEGPAPREYKSIYDTKNCCRLLIEIEPLRKKENITICHR